MLESELTPNTRWRWFPLAGDVWLQFVLVSDREQIWRCGFIHGTVVHPDRSDSLLGPGPLVKAERTARNELWEQRWAVALFGEVPALGVRRNEINGGWDIHSWDVDGLIEFLRHRAAAGFFQAD